MHFFITNYHRKAHLACISSCLPWSLFDCNSCVILISLPYFLISATEMCCEMPSLKSYLCLFSLWEHLATGSLAGTGSQRRCGRCSRGSASLLGWGCPRLVSSASSHETCPGLLFLSSLYLAFKDKYKHGVGGGISFYNLDKIFNISVLNLRKNPTRKPIKTETTKKCLYGMGEVA